MALSRSSLKGLWQLDASSDGLRLFRIDPTKFPRLRTFRNRSIYVAQGNGGQALGKGLEDDERQASAIGECMERMALRSVRPSLIATLGELGSNAISPLDLGIDLAEERAERCIPFSANERVEWVLGSSLNSLEDRWLHRPTWDGPGFYRPTSNGTAVATSLELAKESAVAEMLERHAFILWWYGFSQVRTLCVCDQRWEEIAAWLNAAGWQLHAYQLDSESRFPVIMANASHISSSGKVIGTLVGLGTAKEQNGSDLIATAAISAALEIVQAMEAFSLKKASDTEIISNLTKFMTPEGAKEVLSRLPSTGEDGHSRQIWTVSAIAAAREAGIRTWITDYTELAGMRQDTYCVQAFSPDVLPFPLSRAGRRLNHPELAARLKSPAREICTIPSLPHPLS